MCWTYSDTQVRFGSGTERLGVVRVQMRMLRLLLHPPLRSRFPPRGGGRKCSLDRWAPRAEGRAEMTQAAPEAAPRWGCGPGAAPAGPGLFCIWGGAGPGRAGEGALRHPRLCWHIAPRAVCPLLPAGAMAAERTRPLGGSGGPRAPSRCEPRAKSRAPGLSLRSVPRGTRLREQGTWERRTGLRALELMLEMGKSSLGVTAS